MSNLRSTRDGVAGKVEDGESSVAAAHRETLEETGLSLLELSKTKLRIVRRTVRNEGSHHIEIYFASVNDDCPVTLNYEHSDFIWTSFAEAQQLVTLADQKAVISEIERVYTLNDIPEDPAREIAFHEP